MPPLFFALAAASSDAAASRPSAGGHLALLPGAGDGWQSARCCAFPQELLLQLERGCELHEVEVAVRGDLAPSAVEIWPSHAGSPNGTSPAFEHAGTLRFEAEDPSRRVPTARRARLKVGALCSGQIRVLVHEPAAPGASSGNPYRQVGIASIELWGYEVIAAGGATAQVGAGAAAAAASAGPSSLGGELGEAVQVLTELGIPLDVVPTDEEEHRFARADAETRRLLVELQRRRPQLMEANRFGEAQRLSEQMQSLAELGAELQRLRTDRDRFVAADRVAEAERLSAPIRDLEATRLSIAALQETDWWLEQMALPPPPP